MCPIPPAKLLTQITLKLHHSVTSEEDGFHTETQLFVIFYAKCPLSVCMCVCVWRAQAQYQDHRLHSNPSTSFSLVWRWCRQSGFILRSLVFPRKWCNVDRDLPSRIPPCCSLQNHGAQVTQSRSNDEFMLCPDVMQWRIYFPCKNCVMSDVSLAIQVWVRETNCGQCLSKLPDLSPSSSCWTSSCWTSSLH